MLKYPASGCQTAPDQGASAQGGVSRCPGRFPSRGGNKCSAVYPQFEITLQSHLSAKLRFR